MPVMWPTPHGFSWEQFGLTPQPQDPFCMARLRWLTQNNMEYEEPVGHMWSLHFCKTYIRFSGIFILLGTQDQLLYLYDTDSSNSKKACQNGLCLSLKTFMKRLFLKAHSYDQFSQRSLFRSVLYKAFWQVL